MSHAIMMFLAFVAGVAIQSDASGVEESAQVEVRASQEASGNASQEPPAPVPQEAPQRPSKVRGDIADLLEAVPAEAALVVSIRDLATVDAKIKNLSGQLGLLPVSLYELAKGQIEIVVGIEDHGAAALLIMPAEEPGSIAKSMAMLLPTTDQAQMLSFLSPKPPEDGFTRVTLQGRETYVATKGSFTVFGADLNTVRSVVAAKVGMNGLLGPHQQKRFAENDFTLWINTASVESSPLSKLPIARHVRSLAPPGGWVKRYASIQTSLRFEREGITVELYGRRAASSEAAPVRASSESLLRGLPNEPFVFAMGLAEPAHGTLATWPARMMLSAAAEFEVVDPARVEELGGAIDRLAARTSDVSASIVALPEGPDGLIGQSKVVQLRGNPPDPDGLRSEFEAFVNLMRSGVFLDPDHNAVAQGVRYLRAAETSAGVSIDHLTLDLSEFEAVDQEALKKVVGKEGLLVRLGVVDKKFMVSTFGGGLGRFDTVVTTVRAGRTPLSTRADVKKSAPHVAARRWCEGYLALDVLSGLVSSVNRVIDRPTDFPAMPEVGAPVVWSIHSVGRDGTQADLFVPIELVVALKDAAMQRAVKQVDFGTSPDQ